MSVNIFQFLKLNAPKKKNFVLLTSYGIRYALSIAFFKVEDATLQLTL